MCGQRVVCELNVDVGRTFSEKLLEMVDFVLRLSQVGLRQLDLLAVATGPGSFTGLRVGITTMKALAMRLGRPLVGVTSLEALAEIVPDSGMIAAFMDARRRQVFAALYEKVCPNAPPHLRRAGEVADPARWIASLYERQVKFVGDGTLLYRDLIEQAGHIVVTSEFFLARVVARVALRRRQNGDIVPLDSVDAYYIRPSDAETKRTVPSFG